jgi:hypothetical protein
MKTYLRLVFLIACLATFGMGCSNMAIQSMPAHYPRFATASSYGEVWMEGRFYTNHEQIFGTNLLEKGYVPVAIRIFFRDGESVATDNPRVSLEDIRPTLFLPDGTALEFVAYDRIAIASETDDRITEESFYINIVKPDESSKEGFIFFALPKDEFLVRDNNTLVHIKSPLAHEVRLSESLIALEYFTDKGKRPIYVGLRKSRRSNGD